MPTNEQTARVLRLETDAALISIIVHALADLLVFDQSDTERQLTLEAARAITELRRRNHQERNTRPGVA